VSVINFTVRYDLLASQTDLGDVDADSDLVPLVGTVVFTPLLANNRPVLAATHTPRPAGLKLQPISGYLDTDGQLRSAPGGLVGVRLPAADPIMDLDTLYYRVDFTVRTTAGEPVRVDPGYFQAPITDSTVQLAEVMESTVSAVSAAPNLVGGTFNIDGDVVFQNADGSVLQPIEIPEGYLVFVDNGDSTWSVG
jgi:hypothetical protein